MTKSALLPRSELEKYIHSNGIDRTSNTPLYYQLYESLRTRILNGEWQPNDLLPAEPELTQYYGVSRTTLRQATDLLAQEKLIRRQRGKGTYVTSSLIRTDARRLIGFSEDMRRRGLNPSSKVLDSSVVLASTAIADKLQIEPGEELIYLKRLRLADKEPMCVEEACLVHRYCPGLIEIHDFSVSSLQEVLERDYSIRLAKAWQTVTAQTATHELSDLLELPARAPILHIERITYSQLDKPVVFVCIHYRGDRYSLVHELHGS